MYTGDITAIKSKDLEKRRIEEILDKTNEVARIGTWEVDVIQNTVKWSRITKAIHEVEDNYEPELSTAIQFFKEGKSREKILHAVENAVKYGTSYDLELELVTAKGNLLWVRSIGQAEFENGKCKRLYGVFQDIDEAKKSKEYLNKLNQELETIFNSGHVSIIRTDVDGLITHFNQGAEKLLQYSATEMIGKQTPAIIHLEEEVVQRGKELTELLGRPIMGFDVFVELAKQENYESRDWTYVRKDGSTYPVQLVVTVIRNREGEVVGFLGVGTDITETKRRENEIKSLLEITISQNERLKNFAHIVSHNLRSHSGNIDMLLDLYMLSDPTIVNNDYISLLKQGSTNLKETIANLNEVVQINTSIDEKLISINLYKNIESVLIGVIQLANEASVSIVNEVEKEVNILGIPAYLDSIILNFITNGIKYRSVDRKSTVILSSSIQDDFVLFRVEDNGVGIDLKKHGAKLFGMYKTFHGNEDARGIGLFITKNQIEAIGGRIEVESKLNAGTIFNIYLKHEQN